MDLHRAVAAQKKSERRYGTVAAPGNDPRVLTVGAMNTEGTPDRSDDLMTAGKWALGPSVAAVQLKGDFTYGLIASQLWSFAGSDKRSDLEVGTLEPFVTYRTENLWNLSLRVPSSYDFISHQWLIPVSLTVEKLVSFQAYPVTISFGLRYWADGPDNGPHDLAFRFGLTFVFPN